MKTKRHMTAQDRHDLELLLKLKMPVKDIAAQLGFSKVAIYAEIKKGLTVQRDYLWNEKVVYLSDVGQRKHEDAESHKGRPHKIKPDDEMLDAVKFWINEMKYSPEAAVYKTGYKDICIKTIYNYIHSGYIPGLTVYNLPYARPHKKKKEDVVKRVYKVRGKSIEERDKNILKRDEFGHWEMDTVYSSKDDKSCLLVLSERMSRKEIVIQTKDRTSKSILNGLNRLEKRMGAPAFRSTFKTITCDNGVEFSDWQAIENSSRNKGKRTELYFCHPYSSCERGTNENINRMIRRWIPKGDDIGLYSFKEIQFIQDWINDYPRRMFGGLSSNEFLLMHKA